MSTQSEANVKTTATTLLEALWPAQDNARVFRALVMVFVGVGFLTASSYIRVPMWPVPMTMQTFAVLGLGAAYGLRLGGATVLTYLAVGIIGGPVFSDGASGWAYFTGTTGGYLFGFMVAAALVGWVAERGWDRNFASTILVMLVGNALIYVPGLLWLGVLYGWDKPILEWGLTPFILGDVTKLALAAALMPVAWTLIKKWKRD